jgi:BMFP domain-containing protein YqiC
MSKASNDIFSTLRTYITKVTEGERTPAEVAAAVNSWARESADALKAKIHEEVEASVAKMGFIKRDEFDRLAAQVAALNGSAPTKQSSVKKSSAKPAVKKTTMPTMIPRMIRAQCYKTFYGRKLLIFVIS